MSEVKKFTGYIAIDGSHHEKLQNAVSHTRDHKIKEALRHEFDSLVVTDGDHDANTSSLDEFIFKNRESILKALNQDVLLRKKRTPKVVNKAETATA